MWRSVVVWLFLPAWASTTFIKVDCFNDYLEGRYSQQACQQRDCIYDTSEAPTCYFKAGVGYKYSQDTRSFVKNGGPINPWTGSKEYPQILFKTNTYGKTLNVRITGTNGNYYEPPLDLPKKFSESSDSLFVRSYLAADPFYFEVVRKSTGRKIFDTSPGGIIMSDQFLQIVSILPFDKFYGLGEQAHKTLKNPMGQTVGLFAENLAPSYTGSTSDTESLSGVHPFYIMLEPDSKAHGVFFLNSNPQEFNLRSTPEPNLVYRTIGGILDIYFFPGPTPEEVIRQYHAFIGKPYLPPYWSLGYQNDMVYRNLVDLQESHNRLKAAGIPLDVAFMNMRMTDGYQDFTIDGNNFADLPKYLRQLKLRNVKICIELLPAVGANSESLQIALNNEAKFVEWERMDQVPAGIQNLYPFAKNTKIMLGTQTQDVHEAYPDFLDSTGATQTWWTNQLLIFQKTEIPFDGVLLYHDEPFNYGTNSAGTVSPGSPTVRLLPLLCPRAGADSVWDVPPYKTYVVYYHENAGNPVKTLSDRTLCLLGVQNNGTLRQYDVHSLYGWSTARATKNAVETATSKRGMQISRSTFVSSNRYTGHYLQASSSTTWEGLQGVVVACQEFNIIGIPYVGSEICGGTDTGSQELCARWHQFGALTSFMFTAGTWSANKDPGSNPTVGNVTKKALQFRYNYMPYLYTLHHLSSTRGGTVLRPVFFEYPYDTEAQNLNYQFMLGSAIMAAPVVFPGISSTDVYFPDGNFYSLYEDSYAYQKEAGFTTVSTPLNYNVPVFVKAGNIIPRQKYALTLTDARKNPFEVLIVPDEDQNANGMLRWDDGESIIQNESPDSYWDIQYQYSMISLSEGMMFTANVTQSTSSVSLPLLNILEIFNYQRQPDFGSFKLNGNHVAIDTQHSRYSPITKVMIINTNGLIQMSSTGLYTLTWKDAPVCYFKAGVGYKYSQDTRSFVKNGGPINPWTGSKEYPQILFKTNTYGKTLNVRITGTNGNYYEPPLDLPKKFSESPDSLFVRSYLAADPFYFEVVRKSTGRKIFDTSPGGIIMSDQFLQIVSMLPSDKFYGLGERAHKTLKNPMGQTVGLFAKNLGPNYESTSDTQSLPGVHPFYIMLEPDSKAHGVFFLNSNPQEFNLRSTPEPNLVYRTIGGILDIYFFPGPTPEEVIRQYHAFIGKPYLPPYWSLGYQNVLNYPNLIQMQQSHNRLKAAGIPLDVATVSMAMTNGNQDFTINGNNFANLPQYVQQLNSRNVKICIELLPAVGANTDSFQKALAGGAKFVEWERMAQVPAGIQNLYPLTKNTKIMLGTQAQDVHEAYPDFLDSTGATQTWWTNQLLIFYFTEFQFDGVLLYNDEPFNYGTNSAGTVAPGPAGVKLMPLVCPKSGTDSIWDVPPYKTYVVYSTENTGSPKAWLSDLTLCLLGVQNNGTLRQYDVHSLYGWSVARATKKAVERATGKRGFQISRSTFSSSNRYTSHYFSGAAATWEYLQGMVVACQEFNIFGIPFVGSQICGGGDTGSQELCARWHQFGALTSFMFTMGAWSANKDPGSNPTVGNVTKKALQFRYNYMPYLYTLHHLSSTRGGTVLRPVFFEYPYDTEAQNLNYQFMLGSAIMAAPVVFPGISSTDVYFPDGNFYSLYEDSYAYQKEAGFTTVSTPLNYNVPVFVKAGNIIPRQKYALTLTDARKNPFEVLIVPDEDQHANGMLRWDDGESIIQNESPDSYWDIQYQYSMISLSEGMMFTANVTQSTSSVSLPLLNILEIFNYQRQPDFGSFKLNGNHVAVDTQQSRYSPITKVVIINTNGLIQMSSTGLYTLTWKDVIN